MALEVPSSPSSQPKVSPSPPSGSGPFVSSTSSENAEPTPSPIPKPAYEGETETLITPDQEAELLRGMEKEPVDNTVTLISPEEETKLLRGMEFVAGEPSPTPAEIAYRDGAKKDAASVARVLKTANALGQPADLIEKNLETAEIVADSPAKEYWAKLEREHPEVAKWYADRRNAAMGKGKAAVDNAVLFSQTIKEASFMGKLHDSVASGLAGMYSNIARFPGVAVQGVALPYNLLAKATGQPQYEAPGVLFDNSVTQYFDSAKEHYAGQVPELQQDWYQLVKEDKYKDAAKAFVLHMASNAPSQVAMVASSLGPQGAARIGLGFMGGLTAAESMEEGRKKGATPLQNTVNALVKGTIEVKAEQMGTGRVATTIRDKMVSLLGKERGKKLWGEIAILLGFSAHQEGTEEFVTSIGQDLSDVLTRVDPDKGNAIDFMERGVSAYGLGAGGSVAMTAPIAGAAGVSQSVSQSRMEARAKSYANAYLRANRIAEESPLRKISKTEHAKQVAKMTENSSVKDVYTTAEHLQTYFQEVAGENAVNVVDARQVARVMGVEKAFDESMETGLPFAVPLSSWILNLPLKHREGMATRVTPDARSLSIKDIENLDNRTQSGLEQELESAGKRTLQKEEEAKTFNETKSKILSQLKSVRDPNLLPADEAKQDQIDARNAEIAASFVTVLAKDKGISVDEALNLLPTFERGLEGAEATKEGVYNQPVVDELGFYSQVEAEVEKIDFGKQGMPAKDLAGRIRNLPGLKAEELEYIELEDWLAAQEGKVSKEAVLEYIRQNGVSLEQTVLSEDFKTLSKKSGRGTTDSDPTPDELSWDDGEIQDPDYDYLSENAWENIKEDLRVNPPGVTGWDNRKFPWELARDHLARVMEEGYDENYRQEQVKEKYEALVVEYTDADEEVDWDAVKKDLQNYVENDMHSEEVKSQKEYYFSGDDDSASYKYTESETGWTLEGMPRIGDDWYSPDTRKHYSGSIEEAKIKLLEDMIEKGVVRPYDTEEEDTDSTEASDEDVNKPTGATRWQSYKVPGGKNYREILITIPVNKKSGGAEFTYNAHYSGFRNFLFHLRVSDRTDVKGRKVLAVEEWQSDWASQARKFGFQNDEELAKAREQFDKLDEERANAREKAYEISGEYDSTRRDAADHIETVFIKNPDQDYGLPKGTYDGHDIVLFLTTHSEDQAREEFGDVAYDAMMHDSVTKKLLKFHLNAADAYAKAQKAVADIEEKQGPLREAIRAFTRGAPQAPFVGNTEGWTTLAMKRLLRLAAEQGYEALAFFPPEVHLERWGTDSVSWHKVEAKDTTGWRVFDGGEDRDGRYGVEDAAENSIAPRNFDTHEEAQAWIQEQAKDHFLVGAVEQLGGNAGGVDIEGEARRRGMLLEKQGEAVTTKDELAKVLNGVLSRDRGENTLEQLTDSLWKKMQAEPSGIKQPAKEGYEFLYGKLPVKIAQNVLKKLDKSVKPEVGEIATDRHGWEIPITPALKEAVMKGQPLFQKDKTAEKQGEYDALANVIRQFRKANASTAIHELMHWRLEQLLRDAASGEWLSSTAGQEWVPHIQALREWVGAESGATKFSREQHEKVARGFEAYIREGNAPTERLRQAFRAFKKWLVQIYASIKGGPLDVNLSDEVRAVFDRMLASQEEIDAELARRAAENPAAQDIDTELESKFFPEDRAKIRALREKAKADAEEILLRKQMEELSATRQEKLSQERERLQKELKAQVEAEPFYAAQEKLKARLHSKESARQLAKKLQEGKLSELEEVGFETVADSVGFDSADAFAHAILTEPTIAEATTGAVKTAMLAFADLKDTPSLREEARDALYNNHSLALLALERDLTHAYIARDKISRLEKERKETIAQQTVAATKARAKTLIEAQTAAKAAKTSSFQTAERRAAIEAAKAALKKDPAAFEIAKQKQLLNHALAQESAKVSKKLAVWKRYLSALAKHGKKRFKSEDHFAQAGRLLARMGIEMKGYDPSADYANSESLAAWTTRMEEELGTVVIPEWISQNEARSLSLDSIRVSELEDVINTLKNIQQVASFENKTLVINKGESIAETKEHLREAFELGRGNRKDVIVEAEESDSTKTSFNVSGYFYSLQKIETLLSSMDGFATRARGFVSLLYRPVYEAGNHESKIMRRLTAGLTELYSVFSKKEKQELMDKKKAKFYPEFGATLTKMRLVMLALNLGNEGNRQKLFENEPVGFHAPDGWSEQTVMTVLQRELTEKDWDFVQGAWKLINTLWPDVASLNRELTGFAPEKVEARPFDVVLPDGTVKHMEGGYFPLKGDPRDPSNKNFAEEALLESPLYTEQNKAFKAQTKKGHTVARTEAQYPLSLDHSILYRHLRDVAHDLAFRKVVIDLNRIVFSKEVGELFQKRLGQAGYNEVTQWVRAVGAGNISNPATTPLDRMAGWLRRKTTQSLLVFRATSIIENLANPFLFLASPVEGFGTKEVLNAFFFRGVGSYWRKAVTNPAAFREEREFVFAKSEFMANKHLSPELSLYDAHAKAFGEDSKVIEWGRWWAAFTDELTSVPMWMEAYDKKLAEGATEEDALYFADKLIDRTLGSGRRYDAPSVSRGTELARVLTMFYQFMNVQYNRWVRETGAVRVDSSKLPGLLGFMAATFFLWVPASALLSGKAPDGDDDDDDKYVAKWLSQLITYPVSFFPVFRDFLKPALDRKLGLRTFGYRPTPLTAAPEALWRSTQLDGKEPAQIAEEWSKNASFFLGYPDQFNAWIFNANDVVNNGMDFSPSDLIKRRPKKDR